MSRVIKKLKEILLQIIVIVVYLLVFIIKPQIGITSLKNSGYYIKEMLLIMPVIFVLTALLDTWVPKHTIMKHLGKGSGIKGTALSFALGSMSAGPVYAAFPICVMLRKKGASIKNIVIILSTWAVIKIPMLINELKFLGLKFMIVRWILTVMAILSFFWITSKLVKENEMPSDKEEVKKGININQDSCMGCTLCNKFYPEMFEIINKKAYIKITENEFDMEKLQLTLKSCPVNAIEYINL